MTTELSPEEVRHVARLARLQLSDEDVERFSSQLSAVLGHIEAIRELGAENLAPASHAIELVNVLRPDEVAPSLDRAEVLGQAPEIESERFSVPRILGEEP